MASEDLVGELPAPSSTRRIILNALLSSSALAFLATVVYPVIRYIIPPPGAESDTNSVVAGKVKDFPANTGKVFRFGSKPALLVNGPDGRLRAVSAVCTHLQCTVQYRPDLEQIWCACHNGRFDLNGRNVAGPPPRPLEVFDVTVRGDDVIVSRKA